MIARTATLLLAATLALSGCDLLEKQPNEFARQDGEAILNAADEAMGEVSAIHVRLEIVRKKRTDTYEFATDEDGECQGTLTQGKQTYEFLATGPRSPFYLRQVKPAPPAAMGDRWVQAARQKDLAKLCDLDELVRFYAPPPKVLKKSPAPSKIDVGEVSEVDGHDAVLLDITWGKYRPRLWVDTDEPHRVLRAEVRTERATEKYVATGFSVPLSVQAPPPSQVVRP